jgi:hypothetical protein
MWGMRCAGVWGLKPEAHCLWTPFLLTWQSPSFS